MNEIDCESQTDLDNETPYDIDDFIRTGLYDDPEDELDDAMDSIRRLSPLKYHGLV